MESSYQSFRFSLSLSFSLFLSLSLSLSLSLALSLSLSFQIYFLPHHYKMKRIYLKLIGKQQYLF